MDWTDHAGQPLLNGGYLSVGSLKQNFGSDTANRVIRDRRTQYHFNTICIDLLYVYICDDILGLLRYNDLGEACVPVYFQWQYQLIRIRPLRLV